MFKNLKLKFVLIYVFSIFTIVTVSFAMIFYSSYSRTAKDIQMELNMKQEDLSAIINNEENGSTIDTFINNNVPIFSENLVLLLNSDNEIINVFGRNNLNSNQILTLQNKINSSSKIFFFEDNIYAFQRHGQLINMININNEYHSLQSLLSTLVVAEFIIVLLSVIIGRLFATKSLQPVKESFERQQTFISDASHELRTPLSVILSCLELIKEGDNESEKWINYCINETNRLKTLTSTLLTLSSDNKINKKELEIVNISEELDLLLCAYEAKLFEENFDFEINIDEDITIKIARDDFKQFVHILLDNAIKYNNKEKIIIVSLAKESKSAILQISNTSEAIEDEQISKLFDRFYRFDESRNKKVEGFGLGLAIISNLINKYTLKYDVKYYDEMMHFTFKFPLINEPKKKQIENK